MQTTKNHKIPYLVPSDKAYQIAEQTKLVAEFLDAKLVDGSLRGPQGKPGLPGTNGVATDKAMAAYLGNESSESRAAVADIVQPVNDASVSGVLTEDGSTSAQAVQRLVEKRMGSTADPLAYLDSIRVLSVFRMYDIEGTPDAQPRVYMQGFSINKADNELYVALGGGSSLWQRFEVRNLATGERKSHRTIDAEVRSYTEGMPWYKNGSGQLMLMVRLKTYANGARYQFLNMATGALGPVKSIKGVVRGDVAGDYYVSSDAIGHSASEFYVYSWESIKANAPELLGVFPISNPGKTPAKMQGFATTGSASYLYGGDPNESSTVSAYDWTGQLLTVRNYPRPEFAAAVNAERPGTITHPAYEWEAEGATNLDGRLVTGHIISNKDRATDGLWVRWVVIVQHGEPTAPRMATAPLVAYERDTGWVPIEYADGYKQPAANRRLEFRVKDGEVYWRGGVQTTGGDIPINSYVPITKTAPPTAATGPRPGRFAVKDNDFDGYVLIERGSPVKVRGTAAGSVVDLNINYLNN